MQTSSKVWNCHYGLYIFIFLGSVAELYAWDIRFCTEALGMESGAISDEAITASSSYVPNVGPRNGRLKVERAGGGWCPKQQIEKGTEEYIQVDLEEIHVITGVQTQGRYDRGRGQEYAEEYTIQYWRPGWTEWKEYERWDSKKIFRGNSDTFSVETQRLMPPIFASAIRIQPYSVHRRTVCLRIELLGCIYDVPIPLNVTEEETNQQTEKELIITSAADKTSDRFETISAKKDGDPYVEVIIGVLTAIVLLLLLVFMIILVLNKRTKLQGSPTFFRNPFAMKINMKDLLMSFSTSNNNPVNSTNNPVTPVSEAAPSSALFEPFETPFVDTYFTSKYATLRCSSNMEDHQDSPNVPPLPDLPAVHQIPIPTVPSPHHYRTTVANAKSSKMINLNNYFPSVASSDPPSRKRYHTAPREKNKIPPPMVSWNIAPSMGHAYSCREIELVPIPRYSLRPVEKLGSCHAGEITLYETEGLEDIIPGVCRLVIVRTALPERAKSDAATGSLESLREVRFLAGLSDPNICRVLGVCTAEQPPWTVIQYGEMGDLAQYLQFMLSKNDTIKGVPEQPLSIGSLIFMAAQIASGMKYLEMKHVVHKDLAARNCLIGRGYFVKITDVAMCKPQYKKDYAEIGGRPPTPIRWLPWESILLDRYTCASSAWSFAVTLWEILNFAYEKPFSNLTNEKVIQNTEHMYYGGELQVLLNKPTICPPEVYELMCQCWRRDDTERPTFKQIHTFLCHINQGYTPRD